MEITATATGIKELLLALGNTAKKISQELAIAVNATRPKVKTTISKQVREELTIKATEVKKLISFGARANKTRIQTYVRLDKDKRPGLNAHGARQIRKGVSYKISKRGGRKMVRSAFIIQKFGGHVFKREGKNRKPIQKLHGASPWGAYTVQHMRPKTIRVGENELTKQIDRRIRTILFRREKLA